MLQTLLVHELFCNLTISLTDTYLPLPGGVAQSVTCLATDACLTADPGAGCPPVREKSGKFGFSSRSGKSQGIL